MWKLLIEDNDGARTVVPLHREEYAIGRAVGNELRLTNRNVSRGHAILRLTGQSYEIEDLDSYNGTHLNGSRVNVPRVLTAGDVVQVGDYVLVLESEAMNELTPVPPKPAEASALASALGRPARLAALGGSDLGKEYTLDGDEFLVGREEGADIALAHGSVSRRHCRLARIEGDRFDVTDLGSSNGILINGVELRRGVLQPGDTLQVGDIPLRYVAADEVFWHTGRVPVAPPVPGSERAPTTRRSVVPIVLVVAIVAVGLVVMRFVM
jgi:pSer/pThr/pTyr-binding forkhead associated (FHA) protein